MRRADATRRMILGAGMRTLGVHGAGECLYMSVADDGLVVDVQPYTFHEPTGLPAMRRLAVLRDDAYKTLTSLGVERVRILDAEATYSTRIAAVHQRIALETILALSAAEAGIDCARLSRPKARSLLSLPMKGELVGLVGDVTGKVGGQWSPRKRDLAAMAAIAASREV